MFSLFKSTLKIVVEVKAALCVLLIIAGINGVGAQSSYIDTGFNPTLAKDVQLAGESVTGRIFVQPDGKIILSANFMDGSATRSVTYRVNADGSRDTTFNCLVCDTLGLPVLEPDGKLLFAARVPVNGLPKVRFVRVNADGSVAQDVVTPVSVSGTDAPVSPKLWAMNPDGKAYLEVQFASAYLTLTGDFLFFNREFSVSPN